MDNILTTIRLSATAFCLFITLTATSQVLSTKKTPTMGWASWNNFGININESIIRRQADAMVSSGLAAAGFRYINIDDGFFDGRYADGALRINSIKFPNGMKALADYIHAKGLKAGFYSEAGANTCGSIHNGQTAGIGSGLYNHDQQYIDTIFKSWGYDYIKVDFCGGQQQNLNDETRYTAIKKAIDNTGKTDIIFNVCRWQFPGTWIIKIADSWRMSQDINASWYSITNIIDKNTYLAPYASPGHYNDMDMLEVGRGLTAIEDKSHFSMWCILSSPLVLGNDLTTMSKETIDILSNTEVIAVNQDTTGLQAHLISQKGDLQVWAKKLNGKQSKERVVALFNRSGNAASMSIKWKDLNLDGSITVRNLWSHSEMVITDTIYTVTVPAHGVVMLKVVGSKTRLQDVFEAEYGWINMFDPDNSQGKAVADAVCSGGAKAISLGNGADNYIEFRDIFANTAGNFLLKMSYLSAENRKATVSINGKDTLLTNLNSGGSSIISNIIFSVKLNSGNNTIRISNTSGSLPDLDNIQLDLNHDGSFYQCTNMIDHINVTPEAITLIGIDTASLKAEFYPYTVCYKNTNWRSSDESIVKVDFMGKITSVKVGSAWIKATSVFQKSKSDSCLVTVTNVPVTGIYFNTNSTEVPAGTSKQLSVNFLPKNAINRSITWISNDNNIATVDLNGIVKGVNIGKTMIIATSAGSTIKDTCYVEIILISVTGIKFSRDIAAVWPNQTASLNVIVAPANAFNTALRFTSLNPEIASVNSSGVVTGLLVGTTKIVAISVDGGFKDTCNVKVMAEGLFDNSDVGNPCVSGSSTSVDGAVTIMAGGADIWDKEDAFHLVYKKWNTDGAIIARVTSLLRANDWTKAGLMIRESLEKGSKHAMIVVSPDHGTSFQFRSETDKTSNDVTANNGEKVSVWLKLTRTGNVFTGYSSVSVNAETWTKIGETTIDMPQEVNIGLIATSHKDCTMTAAIFDYVTITQNSDTIRSGISNNKLNNNIKIWLNPLPGGEEIKISGLGKGKSFISIISSDGKILFTNDFKRSTISIRNQKLTPGVYIIRIQKSEGVESRRMVVI